MSKFSKYGWDSDFKPSKFTDDGMQRFIDDRRDELNGRHDAGTKPGKTIHKHKLTTEAPRDFSKDELFQTLLQAAEKGDCQSQYRVGMEYLKEGNLELASKWLKLAADRNWPDASEAIEQLKMQKQQAESRLGLRPRHAGKACIFSSSSLSIRAAYSRPDDRG